VERGPLASPGTALCSGPNWSFSSDRNSPKSTNLPSRLSGTVNSSDFSTKKNQTLDTSYASKQSFEEVISPEITALSSSKINSKEGASLSFRSEVSFDSSWGEEPGVRSAGSRHLQERPLTSTAVKGQSKAVTSVPAEDSLGVTDTDFDLDHFDIDDFDEAWEDSVNVSAPETPSAPLCQPVGEGPPARSLWSKIMSRAKGSAVVSSPAVPKSSFLMATKNHSGELCSLGLLSFPFKIFNYLFLNLRPSNLW